MVTTEVRVTAEASTSEDHITPSTTPTPSIAPVLPIKPATHQHHHPWASPSSPSSGHHLDLDDFDLDLDLESAPSSSRTRGNTTTTISGPPVAPFVTISSISSAYVPPTNTRTHRSGASAGPKGPAAAAWWPSRLRSGTRHFVAKLGGLDPVKLAYLRTSFVFAISILITWAPSSINRVYTLVYPQRFNFGLNMASAVVLPLQGVWNCVIYCATSWYVLLEEMRDLEGRVMGRGKRERGLGGGFDGFDGRRRRGRGFELSPRVSTMRVVRGGSFSN
jgi:hypothetical protein